MSNSEAIQNPEELQRQNETISTITSSNEKAIEHSMGANEPEESKETPSIGEELQIGDSDALNTLDRTSEECQLSKQKDVMEVKVDDSNDTLKSKPESAEEKANTLDLTEKVVCSETKVDQNNAPSSPDDLEEVLISGQEQKKKDVPTQRAYDSDDEIPEGDSGDEVAASLSDSEDSSEHSESEDESDNEQIEPQKFTKTVIEEEEDLDGPILSKNEVPEEPAPSLPADFKIDENTPVELAGTVFTFSENNLIVKSSVSAEYRVLSEKSILCLADKTPLGFIFEVFGPLKSPFYRVKFNESKDPADFEKGTPIYYVVPNAQFELTEKIRAIKGCDASNFNDEEIPEDELEFSDDEQEALRKKKRKLRKNGGEEKDARTIKPYDNFDAIPSGRSVPKKSFESLKRGEIKSSPNPAPYQRANYPSPYPNYPPPPPPVNGYHPNLGFLPPHQPLPPHMRQPLHPNVSPQIPPALPPQAPAPYPYNQGYPPNYNPTVNTGYNQQYSNNTGYTNTNGFNPENAYNNFNRTPSYGVGSAQFIEALASNPQQLSQMAHMVQQAMAQNQYQNPGGPPGPNHQNRGNGPNYQNRPNGHSY